MAKAIILGTSAALASEKRDNTSFVFIDDKEEKFLIDCPGSPVHKLAKARIDFREVHHIILTHAHPDHIYGLPSLLHSHFRLQSHLTIYAPKQVIKLARSLISLFKLDRTLESPTVSFKGLNARKRECLFDSEALSISCFRVVHLPHSVGIKFFIKKSGKTIVYTGDTAPCPLVARESEGADYLIHDCFCPSRFFKEVKALEKEHTSSLSLGRIAQGSKVKNLIPIHFSTELDFSTEEIISEIRKNFSGRIIIPNDLDILELTSPLSRRPSSS